MNYIIIIIQFIIYYYNNTIHLTIQFFDKVLIENQSKVNEQKF